MQYVTWLKNALHGDFGTSLNYHVSALPLVLDHLKPTLILSLAALLIAIPLGILIGTICAVMENTWVDRTLVTINIFGISIPIFWLGIILIIIFSGQLHLFPSANMHSPANTSFSDLLWHLCLPAVTLSIVPMTVIMRITRSSMIDVIHQDFMRTAKAKGCRRGRMILCHGLKNAFVPILAVLGVEIGYSVGGALVVESVFSWPGIGSLLLTSILNRDYVVVICGTVVICIVYTVVTLITDLLYGVFDPKIQYE